MGWQKELNLAAAAFRQAGFHLERAGRRLEDEVAAVPATDANAEQQSRLAAKLTQVAHAAAPGFLSADLQTLPADTPLRDKPPRGTVYVRLGQAEPIAGATFPVILPLLGSGHVVVDADASDPRVAGMLRSALLRCLAAVPHLKVSLVDCVALGQTFADCAPLVDADITDNTAVDGPGLERVLDAAEAHVQEALQARHQGVGEVPYHLVIVGGLPPQVSRTVQGRIAALAHVGPQGRTHLIVAGWRDSTHQSPPTVDKAVYVSVGAPQSPHQVHGVPAPVTFDDAPPPHLVRAVFSQLADKRREETRLDVSAILPTGRWEDSSVDGLSTVVGRDSRGEVTLSFDDATPHWLIGGRTGGGKTVFLLDVLYGLAARYGPRELALYLLDFKEGVSFTEFTPQSHDRTWIPHVKAVGVESDREYGNAVLVELRRELSRRASAMKKAGVVKLSDLRNARPDMSLPRVLAVVDEFHVLFAGNDRLARDSADHLEELARKGRSYGVHLILASQTISGVEALYTKRDSIFGQFPMRVALPGAKQILDEANGSAESLRLGQAVVNTSGGVKGFDRLLHFPDAAAANAPLSRLRHELWERREPDSGAPKVFEGFAEQHLDSDPVYAGLRPGSRRLKALVGREVNVAVSTLSFDLDPTPGRHLAVLGASDVGADVVQAATLSLARQVVPGEARFLVAGLASVADTAVDETETSLKRDGHDYAAVKPAELIGVVDELLEHDDPSRPVYLALFGGDVAGQMQDASAALKFQRLLKQGPGKGVHVLGWWRGLRRFIEAVGGSANKEDVACLVVLNVPGSEIGPFIGDFTSDYEPRPNRALAIDRHENTTRLCVPFVRPGRQDEEFGT
ncbi:MAG: FtsK/SpoIIIE domain-containing protein [Stackebrandtia sp.]